MPIVINYIQIWRNRIKTDTPIQRIKEAPTEIRQVARKEPVPAAEGAIVLLEKLSPALLNVNSSSGALGIEPSARV